MNLKWSEAGFAKRNPSVRDLWAHKDPDAPEEFSAEVPSRGIMLAFPGHFNSGSG